MKYSSMLESERTHSSAAKAAKRQPLCVFEGILYTWITYNNLVHRLEKRYIKDSLSTKDYTDSTN